MGNYSMQLKNWRTASIKSLTHVLSESKDFHNHQLETFRRINDRALQFLSVTITIVTVSLAILVQNRDGDVYLMALFGLVPFVYAAYEAVRILVPNKTMYPGNPPKQFNPASIDVANGSDEQQENEVYRGMLVGDLNRLQGKIDYMDSLIKKVAGRLTLITIMLPISIVIETILLLLV